MEMIASHMKLADWKQSSLCQAHEQLHSEASKFLLFSLQWKDLETHFDSTREMIQTQYEELERREKVIASKEEELDDVKKSIHECSKELELKKNELIELNRLIEKCDGELRLKEVDLDAAQERLGILLKDFKLKEDEVNKVCITVLDAEECKEKEKPFDMVQKRIDDCELVMELNEQKLNEIIQLIEERSMKCELKGTSVESIRALLQEHEEELAAKMAIKDTNGKLKLKEKDLETILNMITTKWKMERFDKIEKSIKLRTQELDLKEKEFGLLQNKLKVLSEDVLSKESELESIKRCIKEHSKELDVQEKQLDGTQQSIRDCQNALILLTKYVYSIEKAIVECSKELEFKDNNLDSLQASVDDYSTELPSMMKQQNSISLIVDKCLEGLKTRKEHYNLLRKSIEQRSKNLKNKENDFQRQTEELNKKDEKVSISLKEIESLKTDMDSQMKLVEKGREELRLKEIQCKLWAEKLESKEKDINLARTSKDNCNEKVKLLGDPNILPLKVKTEELGSRTAESSMTLNFHSGSAVDGKLLLVLLCEHLKLHDLVRTEVFMTLQASSDRAKLVLDAMKWFYPPHVVSEDAKVDLHNVKRGCILLCELLLKFSPQITPSLKEEALKLAVQWKARMSMTSENHVEVVAFLLLIANFQLASDFNSEELHILLNSVSQYKQGFELARALGIGDKSSEGSAAPRLVKLEQPESLPDNEMPVFSLKNKQQNMDSNEKRLYLLLNKHLTEQKLMPSAILSILKESSNAPKLVSDVIQVSFHQQLKLQVGFEESFLRWSTLLLKQLKQISPSIDTKVREDALKLAVDWKLNMKSDANDYLDVVGFLQLIASYGLTTSFSEEEILKLLEKIVLHEQASELCLMFGYNQKIQEIVQNLIGTKQFVKAVRFICGYKLECFRPVQILNEYLRDVRNATVKVSNKHDTGQDDVRAAMDEAIDKEIDAVKSVITCAADCNLSSEISSQGLQNLIVSLKDMKRKKRNIHGQLPDLTTGNMQQSHSITVQSQQRPHPTKGKMQAQQPNPTHQSLQQHHPNHQQHMPKKRKTNQGQSGSTKYPQKPPPIRPALSNLSPRVNNQ
ncbi:uncharacterized protein LOC111451040 isoform X1 [Cucurbita moschata]|uniref:Uncharacterized protein LOC111451040 isoform X1 n=1 Tax=Cucurbita moschata TaxID=3662 RepID=A0A6J1G5Q8_CUCMO|nr:uncharacterized protein LOC111451040 isoform X1 [Cucurbita moschata]